MMKKLKVVLAMLLFMLLLVAACGNGNKTGIGDGNPTVASERNDLGTTQTLTATPSPTAGAAATSSPEPSATAMADATIIPTRTHTPVPTTPPTATSTPGNEAPASPEILSFGVTPAEANPGDAVTLTWEARGGRAMICPTARYVLFTEDDCQQVPLSGTMAYSIPQESVGFQYVDFLLRVETLAPAATTTGQISVALKCDRTWFFSDAPQAGICPQEPIRSAAAAQRFERGTMIWMEEPGRYFILIDRLLYKRDDRKQVDMISDPLEITRDTSAEVDPPQGLYAAQSGFGLVWRGDVEASPGYRQQLGWAVAPEFAYEAVLQCDDARPSGGRSWQTCYLQGPAGEVIVLHPLGGWYLLQER